MVRAVTLEALHWQLTAKLSSSVKQNATSRLQPQATGSGGLQSTPEAEAGTVVEMPNLAQDARWARSFILHPSAFCF